jgi:hypothetical protein
MQTISHDELETLLRNVKGTTAVTVTAVTTPRMNKTVDGQANPLYGRVTKRTIRNCMIGFRYENSVNNQLEREGKERGFQAMPRKWGQRVAGTPLVEHNGGLYLECKVERDLEERYLIDGHFVPHHYVEPFLAKRSTTSRQGVDKAVVMIDVALENIEQIRMFGEIYDVVHQGEGAMA